ncbi:MAG: flap endonuclease-1 [Candidatus Thermoplasmatota archaeon]|nr:flap endonuclease-1 [Candidatus Thermoplasmatota archaeon]
MGVDISGILMRHETTVKEFSGQTLAIDAYNMIYQFLSNIRQPDGTPLMDRNGMITSHLSGLFYRTVSMIQIGIKPVYVFDGKPSSLKSRTLEERKMVREKNKIELEKAIESGDAEKIRSFSSRINYITPQIVTESRDLLHLMGVPTVNAISEGEAQGAWMSDSGYVTGVVSQDFDTLLFGCKNLLRNFAFNGRRKLPGRNVYVNVSPESISLEENLSSLGITREQLVDIGILVGTDFNKGIDRVGAKTALNLVKKYGNIFGVLAMKGITIENLKEIRELFLNPPVNKDINTEMSPPDTDGIKYFLIEQHSFSEQRISQYVQTLKDSYGKLSQKTLDRFF